MNIERFNMRYLVLIAAASLAVSCGAAKGVPTEYASACDASHDGKTLEVSGVLETRSSIYCSNRGGRMECPFDFLSAPGTEKKMTADIEVGSGANTVDEIQKGFKKEDIKVRDNAGSTVAVGSDKLRLTGKMMIAPGAAGTPGVCLMQVYKIEK